MRPPMLAGPIDRQVKFLRIGSADLWIGSGGGAPGCWEPSGLLTPTPAPRTPRARAQRERRDPCEQTLHRYSYFLKSFSTEGLRPSDSPTRALAGTPAPL